MCGFIIIVYSLLINSNYNIKYEMSIKIINDSNIYPIIYLILLLLHLYTPLVGLNVFQPAFILIMTMIFISLGKAAEQRKKRVLDTQTTVHGNTDQ